MPYAISSVAVLVVWSIIVYLNERHGLLSCDHFRSSSAKWFAYIWLALFLVVLANLVTGSALAPATSQQLEQAPFYSLFVLHLLLIVFLIGWWAASGRPPVKEFLNIRHERPAEVVAIGIAVGVGAWALTIIAALLVAVALRGVGLMDEPAEPPTMIGWMANLAIWKKMIIIFSAMTVEEAFFRSFLQKRIGLVASTVLFSLAHFTYGNPLLLVGVTVVSIVIGITFYRTKNVIPCVIAHGVFDAIQLFVIIPLAVRMMGIG